MVWATCTYDDDGRTDGGSDLWRGPVEVKQAPKQEDSQGTRELGFIFDALPPPEHRPLSARLCFHVIASSIQPRRGRVDSVNAKMGSTAHAGHRIRMWNARRSDYHYIIIRVYGQRLS